MFTGLIKTTGTVHTKSKKTLAVAVPLKFAKALTKGASVAVDGVCLTAVSQNKNIFSADILPETVKRTMINQYKKGDMVNLEFPTNEVHFHGHVVQGHVDGTAKLISVIKKGVSRVLTFSAKKEILKYVVKKGSITVNGISLTVIDIDAKGFSVAIIPHTWDITNLKYLKKEDLVNIEVDVLAKYAEKLYGKI